MKSSTRSRLVVATLLLLVVVLATWYLTLPRPRYGYANTLAQITYSPPRTSIPCDDECPGGQVCAAATPDNCVDPPQALVYGFSAPLGGLATDGTAAYTAFLQRFTIVAVSPATASADAAGLVSSLLTGGQRGGTPFVPTLNPSTTTLSTNVVPPDVATAGYPAMQISGYGTMAFVVG